MMDQMMSGGMMWGMGFIGLLVIVVLILAAAAFGQIFVLLQKPGTREIPDDLQPLLAKAAAIMFI